VATGVIVFQGALIGDGTRRGRQSRRLTSSERSSTSAKMSRAGYTTRSWRGCCVRYEAGGTSLLRDRRNSSERFSAAAELPETSSELGPAAVLVSVTFQTRTRRFCHWLPAIGVLAALSSSLAPSAGHSPSRIALVLLVLRAAAPTTNDALDVVFQALNRTSESRSGSTSDKCSRACGTGLAGVAVIQSDEH
jgi:hypothetical protein